MKNLKFFFISLISLITFEASALKLWVRYFATKGTPKLGVVDFRSESGHGGAIENILPGGERREKSSLRGNTLAKITINNNQVINVPKDKQGKSEWFLYLYPGTEPLNFRYKLFYIEKEKHLKAKLEKAGKAVLAGIQVAGVAAAGMQYPGLKIDTPRIDLPATDVENFITLVLEAVTTPLKK